MNTYKFETYQRRGLLGLRYYFRFKAPNGEIMFPSQPYKSAQARDEALRTIRRKAYEAQLVRL